jgi:hypothetical protein
MHTHRASLRISGIHSNFLDQGGGRFTSSELQMNCTRSSLCCNMNCKTANQQCSAVKTEREQGLDPESNLILPCCQKAQNDSTTYSLLAESAPVNPLAFQSWLLPHSTCVDAARWLHVLSVSIIMFGHIKRNETETTTVRLDAQRQWAYPQVPFVEPIGQMFATMCVTRSGFSRSPKVFTCTTFSCQRRVAHVLIYDSGAYLHPQNVSIYVMCFIIS